jgi:hypothetical protein
MPVGIYKSFRREIDLEDVRLLELPDKKEE